MKEVENILENWIQSLLEKPIEVLNRKYEFCENVTQELDALHLPDCYHSIHVQTKVLEQLHQKIRAQKCEDAIWSVVVLRLAHSLPVFLAHDLIDRRVAVIEMGHTRQLDEVQWRLATFHEDALYRLIRERYVDSQYSLQQLQVMVMIYSPYHGLDSILYMLTCFVSDSKEKKAFVDSQVKRVLKKKRLRRQMSKHIKDHLKEYRRQNLV